MIDPLEEAIAILSNLKSAIENSRKIWQEIDLNNPGFNHASEYDWEAKQARCWLYGTTNLEECNELEEWYCAIPPLSDFFEERMLSI